MTLGMTPDKRILEPTFLPRHSSWLFFVLVLAFITAIFFNIFFPPLRLKEDVKNATLDLSRATASSLISDPTLSLIKAEHQKALDEITLRIQTDDDWLHKKFLAIGGLVTLFGSLLIMKRIEIAR
jgi:hypothetical protein